MTKTVIAGSNDNHCLNLALEKPDAETNFAEALPLYGVILLMQETSEDEVNDLSSELPTDCHIINYRYPDGAAGCDAVRSYSSSDIFDAYHDAGLTVLSIKSGWGSIKPKLYGEKGMSQK
jgi:hypothetical protein